MCVVLCVSAFTLNGQINDRIKLTVDSIGSNVASIGTLAATFNHKFKSDSDKVGAAYYWIAKNIVYDTQTYFSKKRKPTYNFKYKTQEEKRRKMHKVDMRIADEAFKERKAVARGFSIMFKRLCNNCGVECEIVAGSVKIKPKDIGRKAGRTNYFWNTVKINNKWFLVDVAMGAGSLNEKSKTFIPNYNETFYLTPPDYFFLNHYPKKEEWLYCDRNNEEFSALPLFYQSYVDADIDLYLPTEGTITSVSEDTLSIAFVHRNKNSTNALPNDFSYAFEADRKAKVIPADVKEDKVKLQIPMTKRRYDYLTIFLNSEALVTFKVKTNTL